ncbi:MAG: peptide deformylase [Bacteroidales bacterium]|nr:peptide deformylase [Bacteroidales bacterium]
MVYPILIYGSPVLRKKAFDLDINDNPGDIAANMFATLSYAEGIGLAGPQVSILKNIFIIDTLPVQQDGYDLVQKAFINPEIITCSEDNGYLREGCLSIPGIVEEVKRPESIQVRYRDKNFKLHEECLSGLTARIFQHEYDHLQGILFIDRISLLKKKLIRRKLQLIKRKK